MDLTYQQIKVSPKLLLLLYEDGYAETSALHQHGEEFLPGSFCPLNSELRSQFIEVLSGAQQRNQISVKPEQLIASGSKDGMRFLLWYRKPALTKLYFSGRKNLNDGLAWTPPLLFKYDGKFHVYAVKRRPDHRSKLYQAPFGNIYEDGSICMGTVQVDYDELKRRSEQDAIKYLESLFFNSTFSHANAKQLLKSMNVDFLWKEQIKTQQPFPMDQLVEIPLTFKSLLR